MVACKAHNLEVGGSTPPPATSSWKDVIIGSRPVLKTGGRETGLVGFESPSFRKKFIILFKLLQVLIILYYSSLKIRVYGAAVAQ